METIGKIRRRHKVKGESISAMAFDQPRLRTVKAILAKGLDSQAELQTFDALAETYTQGGRFCRDTSLLLN